MAIKPSPTYTTQKQEFLNSVVNKIGKQEFSDQVFSNPLRRFYGDFIENASDIEEIYTARAEDTGYDKEGKNVLDRVKPTVSTQYHTNEVEHGYKVTVHDKEMRKGFTTKNGVSRMADHIIQSMHNGKSIDEYNDVLNLLKELSNNAVEFSKNLISTPRVNSEESAKNFCKEVKKIILKMGVWSKDYSEKENFARPSDLVLFIDSDVDVEIQMEYLASLFNLTLAQLNETTKISVPNLKTILGQNRYAVLCHEKCLKIHPTYYNIESIRNTRGKFTNFDLVVNTLVSYTTWFPYVVFADNGGTKESEV